MTNLCFSSDLKGLVTEIFKHVSEKEAKEFIVNLDNKDFDKIFCFLIKFILIN